MTPKKQLEYPEAVQHWGLLDTTLSWVKNEHAMKILRFSFLNFYFWTLKIYSWGRWNICYLKMRKKIKEHSSNEFLLKKTMRQNEYLNKMSHIERRELSFHFGVHSPPNQSPEWIIGLKSKNCLASRIEFVLGVFNINSFLYRREAHHPFSSWLGVEVDYFGWTSCIC